MKNLSFKCRCIIAETAWQPVTAWIREKKKKPTEPQQPRGYVAYISFYVEQTNSRCDIYIYIILYLNMKTKQKLYLLYKCIYTLRHTFIVMLKDMCSLFSNLPFDDEQSAFDTECLARKKRYLIGVSIV